MQAVEGVGCFGHRRRRGVGVGEVHGQREGVPAEFGDLVGKAPAAASLFER
ncbi:hypothetical protein ACU686_15885 [Yinghuangia aomiensis]